MSEPPRLEPREAWWECLRGTQEAIEAAFGRGRAVSLPNARRLFSRRWQDLGQRHGWDPRRPDVRLLAEHGMALLTRHYRARQPIIAQRNYALDKTSP